MTGLEVVTRVWKRHVSNHFELKVAMTTSSHDKDQVSP